VQITGVTSNVRSQDRVVGIATRLRTGWCGVRIPAGQNVSLQNVEKGSRDQPTSS